MVNSFVKRELEIYKDAPVAPDTLHDFYLCGKYDHNDETWIVQGENGEGWLEVHEVGLVAFNFHMPDENYDGCTYYVGDYLKNPLKPPYCEAQQAIQDYRTRPDVGFSWSEKFALRLLFGA